MYSFQLKISFYRALSDFTNLFKNLGPQIFVMHPLEKNLVMLTQRNVGSYIRVFTVPQVPRLCQARSKSEYTKGYMDQAYSPQTLLLASPSI